LNTTAPEAAEPAAVDDSYRLESISPARAPTGAAGRDWLSYRIIQGANVISGLRQGSLTAVTAEVEKIVSGLNERRFVRRGRVHLTPSGRSSGNAGKTGSTGSST
jgi:hypothetical protein